MSLPFNSFLNQKDVRETGQIVTSQQKPIVMNDNEITGLPTPTVDTSAARKKYIDDEITAVETLVTAAEAKIAIESGTHYWSAAGTAFIVLGGTANYSVKDMARVTASTPTVYLQVHVNLPDGAVVTSAKCDGTPSETWELARNIQSGGTKYTMATANLDTADTSINYATIDNSTYSYYFYVELTGGGDDLDMARITYTL